MTSVNIKEHEHFEVALRRLKRSWEKSRIPAVLRAKESYEKPTTARKRKRDAAVKRLHKRLWKERFNTRSTQRKTYAKALHSAESYQPGQQEEKTPDQPKDNEQTND